MASSLEGNKIFAAILTAGIIGLGSGVVSRILYQPHELEEPVIRMAAPEGGAPAGEEPTPSEPLPVLLAAADPAQGEQVAKKCATCHSFDQGGPNKIGPNLYGIVGNKIAHAEGFAYSDAMAGHGGEWTFDNLDHFLKAPKEWLPGTKMTFAGLPKDTERAAVIAYLRTLSDSPVPLPEAPAPAEGQQAAAPPEGQQAAAPPAEQPTAPASEPAQETAAAPPAGTQPAAEAQAGEAGGVSQLVAAADVAAGQSAARKCQACHSFDEGGPNKVGPNLWGVVGRPIGQHEGFKYSEAMAGHGGQWTLENLDHYLAAPKEWLPGNKMAFAGVKKEEERAAILAYLRSLSDNPVPLTGG
jgi:cytochrome c